MFEGIYTTDWAKLAAFIDGEGCISIYQCRYKAGTRSHYELKLNITNTDPRLMNWLHRFGVGQMRIVPVRKGWSTRYDWTVSGKQAAAILMECMPHFVMKGEQALIAITFQGTRKRWGKGRRLPDNVVHAQKFCFETVAMLKGRPVKEVIQ